MKIAERMFEQDGKVVIQKTHDFRPDLQLTSDLRSAGADSFGESKLVGVIPVGALELWGREAGLKGSDPDYWQKMQDVVKRKLLDSDNAQLRVWEGTY